MNDDDGMHVTYDIRELLAGIKQDQATGFGRMEGTLKGKADKTDVVKLESRLDEHARDIGDLQRDRDERQAALKAHERVLSRQLEWRRWAIPTVLTAVFAAAAIVQLFFS